MEENLGAPDVDLTPEDLQEIDRAAAKIAVHGHRHSEGSTSDDRSLIGAAPLPGSPWSGASRR
jgi:hypothetical protein